MRIRFTPDQATTWAERLAAEYAAGATFRELADKHGLAYGTVHKLVRRTETTIRPTGPRTT